MRVTIKSHDDAGVKEVISSLHKFSKGEMQALGVDLFEATRAGAYFDFCGYVDDKPIVVILVERMSLLSDIGHVSVLLHKDYKKYSHVFAKHSRPLLSKIEENFNSLTATVREDNTAAVRWLSWLGFKETHRFYHMGFHTISMKKDK